MLRLAASVEQLSPHVLARALVAQARERGLSLTEPTGVTEEPGRGVRGSVDGRQVRVGQLDGDLPDWAERAPVPTELAGRSVVWVSGDAGPLGAILLEDPVRPDARRTVRRLREAGLRRIVMVTGDRPDSPRRSAGRSAWTTCWPSARPQEKADPRTRGGATGPSP